MGRIEEQMQALLHRLSKRKPAKKVRRIWDKLKPKPKKKPGSR